MPMGQSKGTDSLVQIPSPQSWHLKQIMTGTKYVVESLHLISTVTWQVTPVPGQPRTASLASCRSPDPSLSPVSLHHKHKLCHCKGNKGPVTGVTRTILPLPFSLCEWHSQVLSPSGTVAIGSRHVPLGPRHICTPWRPHRGPVPAT